MDENLTDSKREAKASKVDARSEEKRDIVEERRGKEPQVSYTEKQDGEESMSEEEEESEEEERFTIRVTPDLTAGDLVARGAFDPDKEKFVDPETGEVVSFHDFVLELGVFDPDHVLVKDLSCKRWTDTCPCARRSPSLWSIEISDTWSTLKPAKAYRSSTPWDLA